MTSVTSSSNAPAHGGATGSGHAADARAAHSGFALGLPPRPALLSRRAWLALIALIVVFGLGVPFATLVVPETSTLHLSAYATTITGSGTLNPLAITSGRRTLSSRLTGSM